MTAEVGAVADELYGLPPAAFTAARDRRAADARQAGDRDQAAEIKQLRRPTASAWLANVLVRERGDQLAELLQLGAAMRAAQGQLAGNELRRLSQQGHELVAALGREARRLGREAGQPVGEGSGRELEDTLYAALADPAASEALRSGRLTTALRYSGFPVVDASAATAAPAASPTSLAEGRPAREPPPAREPDRAEVRKRRRQETEVARRALHEAQAELADAQRTRQRAELAEGTAKAKVARAQAELDRIVGLAET